MFFTYTKTNNRLVASRLKLIRPLTLSLPSSRCSEDRELTASPGIVLFALPAAPFFAAVRGFLLARKSLHLVVAISTQAEHISAKNLSERIEIRGHDKFGRLAVGSTSSYRGLNVRSASCANLWRMRLINCEHHLRSFTAKQRFRSLGTGHRMNIESLFQSSLTLQSAWR